MKQQKTIYMCGSCGNEFSKWSGKCPLCGEWNTLSEVKGLLAKKSSHNKSYLDLTTLAEVKIENKFRTESNISEFNRVLGGGIVPGSVILLGGEPGIGKSTLLLQICDSIAPVLYLSGEESKEQIKIRADRIGIKSKNLFLVSDGDISLLEEAIAKSKPKLIVVDSIQTAYLPELAATPGSMVAVRECGIYLQNLAKKSGIPIVLVGHVTKEGSLAGPRILEHLVDVVLYLEGERFHDARVLRGVKNRFGATNEVGIFKMTERGMEEIKNPSKLFISEKVAEPGMVITATIEGTRPILIEVQALTVPTHFGYPKRATSGFDLNRLNLLVAVISRKTLVNLNNFDVYINIVGGMKLRDPAADLAVCAAIISSAKNQIISEKLCLFGEVGLGGEVRIPSRHNERKKEANRLGYEIRNIKYINQILK